jgi:hypothetical protein
MNEWLPIVIDTPKPDIPESPTLLPSASEQIGGVTP